MPARRQVYKRTLSICYITSHLPSAIQVDKRALSNPGVTVIKVCRTYSNLCFTAVSILSRTFSNPYVTVIKLCRTFSNCLLQCNNLFSRTLGNPCVAA